MWKNKILLLLGSLLHAHAALSWTCSQDNECSSTVGAYCISGSCSCPAGQQMVLGGTLCTEWSPYFTSPCLEDHQCSRLVTNFQCRRTGSAQEGNCYCRDGFHYLGGRCWSTSDYGSPCERDENCNSPLRDPFSLACDTTTKTCGCAPGYYRRQRGECRKIASAVGDACVLSEDCQFTNGRCNINTFTCYDSSVTEETKENLITSQSFNSNSTTQDGGVLLKLSTAATSIRNSVETRQLNASRSSKDGASTKQHGAECGASVACATPFICSAFGTCICPSGYYANTDGTRCYAELGSPATEEQCVGILAEVRDGICTCPVNFFFEDNMRDCVKVARTLTDSCMADNMCHTFGAAVRCSEPALPWNLRSCECIPGLAVWDQDRAMCRLFVGIGESCQVNSDCLAGNVEIECVVNSEGEGICTCPEGTGEVNGLCLTTGLDLGETCQESQECTATANTGCYEGVCACRTGYLETDAVCRPTIGGTCSEDSDCLGDNTVCFSDEEQKTSTCRCDASLVEYDNQCWTPVTNTESVCNVTAQCVAIMGELSECREERCVCRSGYHYRDGRCWPQTGLFDTCARTSECFLQGISDRVVCRNSICQCAFEFPYSEELHTCTSAAATTMGSLLTVLLALFYILSH